MSAPLEFQRFQYAFTAHLRDPREYPCPSGIEERRMRIYRGLVYKNIESFLLTCFPVLRGVLGTRRWTRLVRAFLANHHCQSPFFRQIPDELIHFLKDEWTPSKSDPAYMIELAHYEWVELALSISSCEPDWSQIDREGDLLKGRPVLNPVLSRLQYHWPVHRIGPWVRVVPTETYLLVFRGASDQVQFMEVNAFTTRLLGLFEAGENTGRRALEIVSEESQHPDPEVVIEGGLVLMRDLLQRGALIGVSR
jgi:hypothetical protein